jgi:hypothetical protein
VAGVHDVCSKTCVMSKSPDLLYLKADGLHLCRLQWKAQWAMTHYRSLRLSRYVESSLFPSLYPVKGLSILLTVLSPCSALQTFGVARHGYNTFDSRATG